ncbi:hypothetical protein Tco_0475203 [Tanacetum coccineum]
MDKLEKQLNGAQFNEEIAMVVFKVFKNQFQQFITQHISMDYDQMENKLFTESTLCDAQTFKDILIHQMDSVAKVIVERGLQEEGHNQKCIMKATDQEMIQGLKVQIPTSPMKQSQCMSSRVETNQCDEVKIKVDMDKTETQNIELEHQVASLVKENENLKLVYKKLFDSIKKSRVQTQSSNVTQNEKENLRSTLSEFAIDHILGKDDSSSSSIAESHISELEKESGENICENAKCELQTKIIELEKILTKQKKDFDDVKLELSNKTAKFEVYLEKLENTKVVLERQLARKIDDSKAEKDQLLKEINHLRTQLENLKGKSVETKFDKPSIWENHLLINF